jgi:hypothetical protein
MKVNRIENTSTTAGGIDINTSGNVGIGEDDPTQLLVLKSAAPRMRLIDSDVSTGGQVSGSSGNLGLTYDVLGVGGKNFSISDSTSTRLLIDSSGNVGIGTGSPQAPLHIKATTPEFIVQPTANTQDGYITFDNVNNSARGWLGYKYNADTMVFGVNGGEKARIDSSGRLLVGTTTEGVSGGDQFTIGVAGNNNAGMTIRSGTSTRGAIYFSDGTSGTAEYDGFIEYDQGAKYMRFGTGGGTERMRIDSSGGTRIYSSTPYTLNVRTDAAAGGADYVLWASSAVTDILTGGSTVFAVYTNGNVQNTNNSYGALSDIKLKENIVDASSQWDDIKALRPVNYNFKEGQTHTQLGLIAQEVELVSPGLVTESPDRDEDGNDLGTVTKSVNYSVLYMKAVKALQEAMERIETLEQRLTDAGL